MANRRVFSLVLILGLCALVCIAQETRATISGTVTDSSGAVAVGATLKLTNVDTGVSFTTETNSAGQYRFLFLNPGPYKLSASITGFKSFERDNIVLHVSQAAGIDITLDSDLSTERRHHAKTRFL
ncbi:MAG: carboxypeptidase-like regulatory domain-containing protein [Acidobacteria bacterium]|nr:carboxypeptidase-like regulatory domain-containing protein [Acidobacteriota bacterium]